MPRSWSGWTATPGRCRPAERVALGLVSDSVGWPLRLVGGHATLHGDGQVACRPPHHLAAAAGAVGGGALGRRRRGDPGRHGPGPPGLGRHRDRRAGRRWLSARHAGQPRGTCRARSSTSSTRSTTPVWRRPRGGPMGCTSTATATPPEPCGRSRRSPGPGMAPCPGPGGRARRPEPGGPPGLLGAWRRDGGRLDLVCWLTWSPRSRRCYRKPAYHASAEAPQALRGLRRPQAAVPVGPCEWSTEM